MHNLVWEKLHKKMECTKMKGWGSDGKNNKGGGYQEDLIIYNQMPCNILQRHQTANVNCDQL